MSPSDRHGKRHGHRQLNVKRRGLWDDIYCATFGRRDPKCQKKDNDDKPGNPGKPGAGGGHGPGNPVPQETRTTTQATTANSSPTRVPAVTTNPPTPPSPTTRPATTTSPRTTQHTTEVHTTPRPPSTSKATEERPDPETRPPSESSSTKPLAPSAAASSNVALSPATTIIEGSASQPRAYIFGTPTSSTFTSVIETTDSEGSRSLVTSTGVTVVTPLVPAPTDLDGAQGGLSSPGSAVGASSKSTNVGAIIGGVLGALALLVLGAFAFLLYQKRKRSRTAPSSEFLRRYGNTALNTPRDSNNPAASNTNVSLMQQNTHDPYHSFPYPEKA